MKYALLTGAALLFFIGAYAQKSAFDLYDYELYEKKSPKAIIGKNGIAEINGTLLIKLNKDVIAEAIQALSGESPADMEQLKRLNSLLADQARILELLREDPLEPNYDQLGELSELMIPFYEKIGSDTEWSAQLEKYVEQYEKIFPAELRNEMRAQGILPESDEYIMQQFLDYSANLAQSIDATLNDENVRFALAGFITSRKGEPREIKISDDVDNIESQWFDVPRWEVALSEEDKAQLQQLDQVAKKLESLKSGGEKAMPRMLEKCFEADDCLHALRDTLIALEAAIRQAKGELKNQLMESYFEVRGYTESLIFKYAREQSQPISGAELLISFDRDLGNVKKDIDSLLQKAEVDFIAKLESLSGPIAQRFKLAYEDCASKLRADAERIVKLINYVRMLGGSANVTKSVSQISDRVKRLSFNEIPAETIFDLRASGPRDNGDRVEIRAVLELPKNADGSKRRPVKLTQHFFYVYQIGMYSRVKPLLGMANPVGSGKNVDFKKSQFQFAPAYSILLKWGSRRSKMFNDLWSPGLGLSFMAPDFDTDGIPEFGAGIELALLRDYIATGVGFNFGADEPYYYLGFRLPLGSLPLPLFNDIETLPQGGGN